MMDLLLVDSMKLTEHKHVIGMESKEVFSLQFKMFDQGSKGANELNRSAIDTSTRLLFGKMKIVLLNRFMQEVLSYARNFNNADEAFLKAGAVAREKAVDVMKKQAQIR